eukprot:COSAG03_NODE_7752_length_876_cov_8.180180_2_plen_87_part_01
MEWSSCVFLIISHRALIGDRADSALARTSARSNSHLLDRPRLYPDSSDPRKEGGGGGGAPTTDGKGGRPKGGGGERRPTFGVNYPPG